MFIAEPFTVVKIWNHPRCSPVEGWIKEMWCICTMEFYSGIKKENKTLTFEAKWIDLGHFFNKSTQKSQKYCSLSYVEDFFFFRFL